MRRWTPPTLQTIKNLLKNSECANIAKSTIETSRDIEGQG